MQKVPDSTRVLRIAAWMWLGYLVTSMLVDTFIYRRGLLLPPQVRLYYLSNGAVAFLFLLFAHWDKTRQWLGGAYDALMILFIAGAPIVLHHLFVPRFPPGPLSNIEGMVLRQMPVLFIGMVLVAWRYQLLEVILFSLGTAVLELFTIIFMTRIPANSVTIFFFATIVRTASFLFVGIFINLLMRRLHLQQESLQAANAKLGQYASTLEHLTVSRERNRMARELHDTLAHTLTGLAVQLETVKAYLDIDENRARHQLNEALSATRSGVDETRRAIKSLRASPLDDLGLEVALKRLGESATERAGLDFRPDVATPIPSMAPNVEQTIYRIAQEAVENIVRHANAKTLTIALQTYGDKIMLTVTDDGRGYDMRGDISSGHYGMVGMKERAELVGGKLKIESAPGKGTKITLLI